MVQSLWSQHGALNHLPSLVYLLGRIQHISCWFHQVPFSAGWTEAPWDEKFAQHFYTRVLVLPYQPCHQQPCHHQSITVDFLPCHLQSSSIDFYIATISHTRLTCLATICQARLTFPCHQQSGTADFSLSPAVRHADFSLPPVSRTPCPVATNVLDIQSVHLKAIYSVHFRWMNIAVCKKMSGWLIFYPVHLWKPTHSWTLYHLCDSISIYIKQISLSQHMWYDTFWCGKKLS